MNLRNLLELIPFRHSGGEVTEPRDIVGGRAVWDAWCHRHHHGLIDNPAQTSANALYDRVVTSTQQPPVLRRAFRYD